MRRVINTPAFTVDPEIVFLKHRRSHYCNNTVAGIYDKKMTLTFQFNDKSMSGNTTEA
ncbi:hypothetical protein EV102420_12_00800 [Pseudescherichia vulneris NBRC 102420]|uniref:Uncharacterized protein n=1 Tax=Pseudescherichia vulneris NBRC 102420 TaxID=1115515 RepID=A0A090V5Q7_PSEVU|nr:hypothetical protein EV102420_12_00800 [Pseudescherichia vulneris NBRC 102420]